MIYRLPGLNERSSEFFIEENILGDCWQPQNFYRGLSSLKRVPGTSRQSGGRWDLFPATIQNLLGLLGDPMSF